MRWHHKAHDCLCACLLLGVVIAALVQSALTNISRLDIDDLVILGQM